jgi:condensin complex subunit 3
MPSLALPDPRKTIRSIFHEAQKSAATHRKLVTSLRTVQTSLLEKDDQDTFNDEFVRCLNRVLPVKKSEPTADRVVKFIGHFIQHVQDKGILFPG